GEWWWRSEFFRTSVMHFAPQQYSDHSPECWKIQWKCKLLHQDLDGLFYMAQHLPVSVFTPDANPTPSLQRANAHYRFAWGCISCLYLNASLWRS
ncbi:hypothetical protein GOODEAATRI_018071, partial [Goodea atripinnis]